MCLPGDPPADRVLALTPTGRDGEMVCQRLRAEGYACEVCPDVEGLLASLAGAGVAVIAEEALNQAGGEALLAALEAQEPWSDVPILLLTSACTKRAPHSYALVALFERANVMLLQRPLQIPFFLSAIHSSMRARRRQYQMRDLHRELADAVQLADMFISILGHDLGSPLGAIKMGAELIVHGSQDAQALRTAGRILSSADRIERMIEQLLDFARARHGGVVLTLEATNLAQVARRILQELEDANPSANIQFVESGDMSGIWDPDRLARVLSNLAGNAVKHGIPGKSISVELDGTDPAVVRLRVRNAGAIPVESIPTLFEPFKWTASAKTRERGLGLGLFIAREIVRAHGGEIAVHTAHGETTVFEVTLPRHTHTRTGQRVFVAGKPAMSDRLIPGDAVMGDPSPGRSTEQALRDSEARTRAILDAAIDAIITIDEHGIIESANPATERVFGYRTDELIGQNVKVLMPPPYREEHDGYLRNYLATGQKKIIGIGREVVGCRKDGTIFPMDLAVGEVRLGSRRLFTGIVRDIGERKRSEVQLQEYADQLLRSNQELDDFAYVASHDLKEPLRGIHNYASFLIEDYADQLGEDGRAKLETLSRLSQRMEALIDSLLEFSRVGRVELAMQETDLNALLQGVLESLQISLEEQAVEVRVPRPLPSVRCDRARTEVLFRNLLTNAIKYNDKAHKWVEIGWDGGPRAVTFYVRDNGIGIAAKHLDAVFRIFKRLHGRDKYGGGTGAGLTIVKKIVERQGGRIWVESQVGEGTTFFFTLAPEEGEQR